MISKSLPDCRVPCRNFLVISAIVLLVGFSLSPVVRAQQPTATIREVSGTVSVNGQAQGTGSVLNAGDIIETQAGATVVLSLSDGSELRLGQNSKIDLNRLLQTPTKARKSKIKLWYGKVRALLSSDHQTEGSSFEIETPNALAGVKFSQPDVELIYKPGTKTTIIIAHTVAATVINLMTKESRGMPKEHQAIVQDEFLWIAPFVPGTEEIPSGWKQRNTRDRLFMQSRQMVGRTVSTAPISAGARSETSQSPGLETSPGGPHSQTIMFNVNEE